MIQGDHERIWFRKVTVIPILDSRKKSLSDYGFVFLTDIVEIREY